MKKEAFIIGAGTYGEVLFELAELLGYSVLGFYDDNDEIKNTYIQGVKIMGKFSDLHENEIRGKIFLVAIGNNSIRHKVMLKINKLGGQTPSLIHPTATVSSSAEIGKGVYIHSNTTVWTKTKIGDYCYISPNVVIAHHTIIGKACLISTLSAVGASLKVEDEAFIGMNATIITGVTVIGENCTIGAGAVVIKSTEKNSVYAGVPAKKIRDK